MKRSTDVHSFPSFSSARPRAILILNTIFCVGIDHECSALKLLFQDQLVAVSPLREMPRDLPIRALRSTKYKM